MGKLGWIIPVAIVGALTIAAGAVYFTILDTSKSTYKATELKNEEVFQRQFVLGMANTKESKEIDFHIDQDSLNQILYNATETIREDATLSKYVGDFYLTIKGSKYTFYVNLDLKAIKTRAIIETTLSENDTDFVFKINNIKLGHMGATWIAEKSGILGRIDEAFGNAFSGANLSIKSDLKNKKITYAKEDMEKDMLNLMSSSSGGDNDSLFLKALKSLDFQYSFDGGMHVKTNLESKIKNDAVSDSHIGTDADSHYANYDKALEFVDGTVDLYKTFLQKGATDGTLLSDTAKGGFKQLQTLGDGSVKVNERIEARIRATDPVGYAVPGEHTAAYIGEEEIDQILLATDIVGDNYVFHYKEDVVYIVVDRFYCDLFTNAEGESFFNFTLGVNINGLETRAIIETKCEPKENSFVADFKISNIYYGETTAASELQGKVEEYFESAISKIAETDNSWIIFEPTDDGVKVKDTIRINFDRLIDNEESLAPYKAAFEAAGGTKSITIDKDEVGINKRGKLELHFTTPELVLP